MFPRPWSVVVQQTFQYWVNRFVKTIFTQCGGGSGSGGGSGDGGGGGGGGGGGVCVGITARAAVCKTSPTSLCSTDEQCRGRLLTVMHSHSQATYTQWRDWLNDGEEGGEAQWGFFFFILRNNTPI